MQIQSLTGISKSIQPEARLLKLFERLSLTAKKSGLFFALAIVSVFIPVLHFFLVPVFLILTFYFGVKNFRFEKSVDLTDVTCPVCEKNLNEKNLFYREDEVRLFCYQCQTQLKVF